MSLMFEACVRFEVPDGTNADELAEILDYVKEAVEGWKYSSPRYSAGRQGPWKMSNIDVPSFVAAPPTWSRIYPESQPAGVNVNVVVAASGPVDYKGLEPTVNIGSNQVRKVRQ